MSFNSKTYNLDANGHIHELWEQALASANGIRMPQATSRAAFNLRWSLYRFRSAWRAQRPDMSTIYDNLTVSITNDKIVSIVPISPDDKPRLEVEEI